MRINHLDRLLKIIEKQQWSIRALADAIGWKSHSYLAKILRGEADTLTTDSALRIAYVLGVPVDDIFETKVSSATAITTQRRRAA